MQKSVDLNPNLKMLGDFLDETIANAQNSQIVELIHEIRKLSLDFYLNKDLQIQKALIDKLSKISNDEVLPVARAFNHFLNLVNIIEEYQTISLNHYEDVLGDLSIKALFKKLKHLLPKQILNEIEKLSLDLVLTAHPTEVVRRSLVNKNVAINRCLKQLENPTLTEVEQNSIKTKLKELLSLLWHTSEIRSQKPNPIDEAKWGMSILENSLWLAVPDFLRQLDQELQQNFALNLPLDLNLMKFSSWIGGDRDGNPFVNAKTTQEIIYLQRLKAAQLFYEDINDLIEELSISLATTEFQQKYGATNEPYRNVLKKLRFRLTNTIILYQQLLANRKTNFKAHEIIVEDQELWNVLFDCYDSLSKSGMQIIAKGKLLSCLYRIKAFGLKLLHLDIRQDSAKHSQALAEITQFIGLGDYSSWSEEKKQQFLLEELQSKRPLLPTDWTPSEITKEVLDTFKMISKQPKGTIASYVISMTKSAADILAVMLLLKATNNQNNIFISPLFETLEDLNNCAGIMEQLFEIPWYRNAIANQQMVMIGYSDSAKDAGMLAASWAQYQAQEKLINLAKKYNIQLKLFHGRGGTVGRGGVPAHAALLSQPPGSLEYGLRVTEQGEMLRFKLGLPEIALQTFNLYISAILEANILPPPEPKLEWRDLMSKASENSYQIYNKQVKQNPDFSTYFYSASPINELAKLPLGSRPTSRTLTNDLKGLRAIPWIFAWTQNRLILPAWLGAGSALQQLMDEGFREILFDMYQNWPFFTNRIGMLEMVFSKTNLEINSHYDQKLVQKELQYLGNELREQLQKDIATILSFSQTKKLMSDLPWIADAIALRNIFTTPLNLLQVELLTRTRGKNNSEQLEKALMITIAGISAGMRNTG